MTNDIRKYIQILTEEIDWSEVAEPTPYIKFVDKKSKALLHLVLLQANQYVQEAKNSDVIPPDGYPKRSDFVLALLEKLQEQGYDLSAKILRNPD